MLKLDCPILMLSRAATFKLQLQIPKSPKLDAIQTLFCGPAVDGELDWVKIEEEPWLHVKVAPNRLNFRKSGFVKLLSSLSVQHASTTQGCYQHIDLRK